MEQEKFYIFRTYSAGVFFGNLKIVQGTVSDVISGKVTKDTNASIGVATNCRRLWSWSGAASLSQLAIEGTKQPTGCKFTMTVTDEDGVCLPQVVEVIPCTEEAVNSINFVKEWKI